MDCKNSANWVSGRFEFARLAEVAFVLATVGSVAWTHAEEGGTGHYLPGSISSFVDGTPAAETFVARLNGIYYDGSLKLDQIPIAGLDVADVDATSYAAGLTLLLRPSWGGVDGLSYAMSITIPYVWVDVSASVATPLGTVRRSDSIEGLGDIVLMPLMLNYTITPDLHADFRLGVYAPTGRYEVGRLANTGKNFWTVEPTAGLLYFGQKNGIEASAFVGADFNTENTDTNYQSGTQVHLDSTLAQHFPLAGGLAGAGVTGFWYEQVTGDSGSGATLGDFTARTIGLGPVISYVTKTGGADIVTELKWLHEMETQKRLEGDYIWLKVVAKF